MIPVKTFTFFKDVTNESDNVISSGETSFPYKGDLYIHLSRDLPEDGGLSINGITKGIDHNLKVVRLNGASFKTSFIVRDQGVYAVIGAESCDTIYASLGPVSVPVTVVGKFTFAG